MYVTIENFVLECRVSKYSVILRVFTFPSMLILNDILHFTCSSCANEICVKRKGYSRWYSQFIFNMYVAQMASISNRKALKQFLLYEFVIGTIVFRARARNTEPTAIF